MRYHLAKIKTIKCPKEAGPDRRAIVPAKDSIRSKGTAKDLFVASIPETEYSRSTNFSAEKEPSGIRKTPLAIIPVWSAAAEEPEETPEAKEAVRDRPVREAKGNKANRVKEPDKDRAVCLVVLTVKEEDPRALTDKADKADYPVVTNLKGRVKKAVNKGTDLKAPPTKVHFHSKNKDSRFQFFSPFFFQDLKQAKEMASVRETVFTESKATAKNFSDALTTETVAILNTISNAVKEPFGTAKLIPVTMLGR